MLEANETEQPASKPETRIDCPNNTVRGLYYFGLKTGIPADVLAHLESRCPKCLKWQELEDEQ